MLVSATNGWCSHLTKVYEGWCILAPAMAQSFIAGVRFNHECQSGCPLSHVAFGVGNALVAWELADFALLCINF